MGYEVKPKYIRIKDACIIYALSRSTLYRAFNANELTPIKKGGCVLINVAEIDNWIIGTPLVAKG